MKDKLDFARLPIILLVIAFVGRLIMGASGASFDSANRVFSMVILQSHLALFWPAFARHRKDYRIGGAIQLGVIIALASQILIVLGTAGSYLFGVSTYFNLPQVLGGTAAGQTIGFGQAMLTRGFGLIFNCVSSAILAAIGWWLGRFIPAPSATN